MFRPPANTVEDKQHHNIGNQGIQQCPRRAPESAALRQEGVYIVVPPPLHQAKIPGKGIAALVRIGHSVFCAGLLDFTQNRDIICALSNQGVVITGDNFFAVADRYGAVILHVVAGKQRGDGKVEGFNILQRRMIIGHNDARFAYVSGSCQVNFASVRAAEPNGIPLFRVVRGIQQRRRFQRL